MSVQKQVDELDKQIADLVAQRALARQELADQLCPFKVGDDVRDRHNYPGVIDRIIWKSWASGFEFFVRRTKTDGTPYKNTCRGWDVDKWRLANA